MLSAIGINIHTPGTEAFEDVGTDILTGKRIELDILEYIPDIKGNPQAMEMITELVAKLPEMEIDRFIYGYDTALYHDNNQSMTENVSEIAEALKKRDTRDIALWFADIAADGTEPEKRKRAMELLEKLAEYKPFAKIEEMEEQNCGRTGQGAGRKYKK